MIKFSSGSKFGINVNMHVKASSDRKWAGNERAGDKIRTMSSYSNQTLRVLSKSPMYKLIVLILSPARSLPARFLSVEAIIVTSFLIFSCRYPPPPSIASNGQRPTSSLPKDAKSVLSNWLFSHIKFPYPTSCERVELAKLASLTEKQVLDWSL